MKENPPSSPSITDRMRPIEAGDAVVGAFFLKKTPVLVLAGGEVVVADEAPRRVTLHQGAILDAASDGEKLFTGGDDGKAVLFDPPRAPDTIADIGRSWVDKVAFGAGGTLAWSSGRKVFARRGRDPLRELALASAAGGLAFFPKGFRLAIARYGGATLWYPALDAKPEQLEWKGSHLGVTVSPDQRFVVTTMQEPQLHGWRLEDGQHMRMSGYPGRVRSFAWTAGGKHLATSGAAETILWPFTGKNGPMGVNPRILGAGTGAQAKATVVAGHPSAEVFAVGFSDGLILMVRINDGAEILARAPDGDPASALAWRADGKAIAFGTESGKAGVADL